MSPGYPTEGARVRILVVDDEPMNLELLERSLRRRYEVVAASTPEQALHVLRTDDEPVRIAIIISDYRMPGLTGAELLAESMKTHPDARRVIITGYADADNLVAAINSGQIHYLIKKPWNHQELNQVLEQLAQSYQLRLENRRLITELRATNDELRAHESLLSRNLSEHERNLASATSELERINRDLEVLAYKDSLTGLYNHRAFQERLREEIARARRHGQPLALIFGDLDHFAAINQELGYQIGDEVLRRVANSISALDSTARVRASDIVARYGGEEFAILLPETNKDGANTKAERLRQAVTEVGMPAGRTITISLGLAMFPDDAECPDKLVRCAEAAQQAAKRRGRDQVHLYSSSTPPPEDDRADEPAAPVSTVDDEESTASHALAVAQSLESAPGAGLPGFPDISRFRTYYEHLNEIVAMLRRDRSASCLFVDLSRLRRIELEFGVAQHAEVFVMAGVILEEMRGDCLHPGDLICRTQDDDAFLCVLGADRSTGGWGGAPMAGTESAGPLVSRGLERVAAEVEERLNAALAPEVLDLIRDHPRVSVGYSQVLNNSMMRPERLIAQLVTESRESAALQRQRAAQRNKALLQEVILGDALTPVYQPIVHMESGDIFGFEALTRGPRATPLESPATLFSVADEVRLTFELDRACFRTCLRGAIGLEPVHRLFVNLLPLSFYDSSFIETEVSHLLDAAALTPANVVFEITERLAIENFNTFRRALARYTAMGFGVAIDDVGTRHSNLETVMALRPHFIKVSDVLTRGVARSTVKREMLQSLGKIAEAIDAAVVAEGIETPDDLVVLHDLAIRYGQGFFLARPGPPFPRLRASVRRAIVTLTTSERAPIAAPPADYDDDGERRESTNPGDRIRLAVHAMALGSGRFPLSADEHEHEPHEHEHDHDHHDHEEEEEGERTPVRFPQDELDSFDETTRPRADGPNPWRPLSAHDLGVEPERADEKPLLDSLRGDSEPDEPVDPDDEDDATATTAPGRPSNPSLN